MKKYVAIVHYNRQRAGKGFPWTVHYRGKCIPAKKVHFLVPTESVYKPEKKANPKGWLRCVARLREERMGEYALY
jgi:hypothetical protein